MTQEKYFTLIYGADVTKAANKKITPAAEFSELVTSKELVARIHEETERYRQEVAAECEALKEQAVREGFEQGYKEWEQQLAFLEAEVGKVRAELMKLAMPIALKAAKKIVAGELSTSEEAIFNIVKATAKTVAQHKKIIIYVNKADYAILDKQKAKLKELFEQLDTLSLRERDDVEVGGCIIETERGIINAQLKDRWRTLDAAFESLTSSLLKGSTPS